MTAGWPNGFGEQPLYNTKVSLYENGDIVDSVEKRIGLRSMDIVREADGYGEKFAHIINGIEFFAFGADYVPEDNILSRLSYERTYALLKSCKECNFNVVRVWGGGFYPFDYFCPVSFETRKMMLTANTRSIHHFAESWVPKSTRFKNALGRFMGKGFLGVVVKAKSFLKKIINHA